MKNLHLQDSPEPNRAGWLHGAGIVLLTCLAYANSFPGAFILDDVTLVRDNPLVAEPRLWTILTSDYWGVSENSGLYRPLTILSFALNRILLGPDILGFHAVNVALHALAACLVFRVTEVWFDERRLAWIAAALFAVHPIHTEVVNEVVGRGELLVAIFGLLALWTARRPSREAAAFSVLFFLAALLSKEHAIALLIIIPVADWFFSGQQHLFRRSRYYLALLLTATGWFLVRSLAVERIAPLAPRYPFFEPLAFVDSPERIATALKLQWQLLGKLLLPVNLQGVYSTSDPSAVLLAPFSLAGVAVVVCSVFVLGVVLRGVMLRRRLALLALCYMLSILPASNLLFATGVTFAERLAYLPSVWFCIGAALLLLDAGRLWSVFPVQLVAGCCVFILLCTTLMRNPDFSDPVKLWRQDTKTSPHNTLALLYQGTALADLGHLAEADLVYQTLIEIAPEFPEGIRTYAEFLLTQERVEEAAELLEKTIRSDDIKSPMVYLLLAEALYKLGRFEDAQLAIDSAEQYYQHYWYYWALRAMIMEARGLGQEALDCYFKARPWPNDSDLPQRAGLLMLGMGRAAEAESILREAVAGAGGAAAWNGLGVSLALQGKDAEALQAFSVAVKLEPASMQYRENQQRIHQRK